jgi:hypothetical protein
MTVNEPERPAEIPWFGNATVNELQEKDEEICHLTD